MVGFGWFALLSVLGCLFCGLFVMDLFVVGLVVWWLCSISGFECGLVV